MAKQRMNSHGKEEPLWAPVLGFAVTLPDHVLSCLMASVPCERGPTLGAWSNREAREKWACREVYLKCMHTLQKQEDRPALSFP